MIRAATYALTTGARSATAIAMSCVMLAVLLISGAGSAVLAQTPPPAPTAPGNSTQAPTPASPALNAQQLDALTAPIAAYPDPLLAQVLMATTFPDDVTAAAAWSRDHPEQKGDDAVKAVASMPWDPSVQSLVAFPQALATMAQNPNWVDAIGQAFLAQPSDVMDSVQRLRQAAYQAGNLKTSPQQNVVVQPATNTIVVQPANPQVVYVPAYNPTTFYGPWPYAAYPPVYLPPPPGYVAGSALAAGLAFGTGIAITNALWGGCDWGRHDVNVNVNRYNNINVNHRIDASRSTSNWDRTNAVNNRNRTQANGNRPGGMNGRPGGTTGLSGANHDAFRGRDNAQRDQARQTLGQRTGQDMGGPASDRVNAIRQGGNGGPVGGRGGEHNGGAAASNRADLQNRAHSVNRDNALRDAGNGNAARQSIDRGQQSHAMANAGARGGGMGGAAHAPHARGGAGGRSAGAMGGGGGGAGHFGGAGAARGGGGAHFGGGGHRGR